ncbi:hypothetical protein ACFYT4_21905 [Streptomyces sp. NPDC004609]|uniref:hypothetical protein n=1 Tax=Streptomyces sp. NPDC004609 TaxID=3364704 RepID=UPI0036A24DAE
MPPAAPDFGPEIENYASYQGRRDCDPTAKPGPIGFCDLVLRAYPGTTDLGVGRACGGGRTEHTEGRAWDWGVDVETRGHLAADLLGWLLATDRHGNPHALARRFGITRIIWNGRIWESYRARVGWTPFSGPNPHTDHVHFGFGWAGARRETTWWTHPAVLQAQWAADPGVADLGPPDLGPAAPGAAGPGAVACAARSRCPVRPSGV